MKTRNHYIPKVSLSLLFTLILTALVLAGPSPVFSSTPLQEPYKWAETDDNGITLEKPQKRALLEYALSRLSSPGETWATPPALQPDKIGRVIFISVSDGQKPAFTARGEGQDLYAALDSALAALEDKTGDNPPEPEWIKIDVVREIRIHSSVPVNLPLVPPGGLWGLAFPPHNNLTFLPETVSVKKIIDNRGYLQIQDLLASKTINYVAFRTESFFTDGSRFINLFRGAPESLDPTKNQLMEAAGETANYLARSVTSNGRFIYLYDPLKDRPLGKYNILRHAGALFAMLEYYEATGDRKILEASQRALEYLVAHSMILERNGTEMACVVEGNEVKLGGNGLAALALAKYIEITGDKTHYPLLLKLGEWMLSVQDETGNFTVHKQDFPDGPVSGFRSGYYPGEAIFGLTRIYNLDGNPKWLEGAAAAARYLINVRDKGLKDSELSHDHWLLYGLNELFQNRKEKIFLDHSLRIAGAIISAQNRNSEFQDWNGGFYPNPRSTPAATRLEGLGAAYATALFAGREEEADKILGSLRLGSGFLLRTLITPPLAMYMKNPPGALGGVRESLTDFDVRIDYPQHSLSALLAIASIMENRGIMAVTRDW